MIDINTNKLFELINNILNLTVLPFIQIYINLDTNQLPAVNKKQSLPYYLLYDFSDAYYNIDTNDIMNEIANNIVKKQEFIEEWYNITKMHLFEIDLKDYFPQDNFEDNSDRYVIYDIWIDDKRDEFRANDISIDIDYDLSLDYHLQGLYETVIEDLLQNGYQDRI